jgi:arginase
MRAITVLDAPSNLGLRPPAPGTVPGCYKLAGALRDQRLLQRLDAQDEGVVVPPRYDVSGWKPGDGVLNAEALAAYTRKLAGRVDTVLERGDFLLLLGGDCSILFGPALALRRRGRYGLVYLDGSIDFRHVGNSDNVGASGGEGTAIVTGRAQPDIADLDGLSPYVREDDLVILGVRDYDDDAPEPGGLDYPQLVELLRPLVADPACVGLEVTIYDPDLDPDGRYAAALTDTLVQALRSAD